MSKSMPCKAQGDTHGKISCCVRPKDLDVYRAVRQTQAVKTKFNSVGSIKTLVLVWHFLIGMAGVVVSNFLFRLFDLRIDLGAEETM